MRAGRGALFDAAQAFTPAVAVDTPEGTFVLSTADRTVARSMFASRQRGEMRVLHRAMSVIEAVGQGDVVRRLPFVDVGANIGTTTVPAVLVHGFAGGVAVEPEPFNQRLLAVNLIANGIADRVRVVRGAASDQRSELLLEVSPANSGAHRVRHAAPRRPRTGYAAVTVPAFPLDELVERGVLGAAGAGLLWMDVQGHEGQVVIGAGALLAQGPPVVLEYAPAQLQRFAGVPPLLAGLAGYTHFVDLRTVRGQLARPMFELVRFEKLEAFSAGFGTGRGERRVTDLMLLRLDPAVASDVRRRQRRIREVQARRA